MGPPSWVTFDCYGTLIDWERGVTDALLPLLPGSVDRPALARRYIEVEAGIESHTYVPYVEILDRAGRALLKEHGVDAPSPLPASIRTWRPFPEVPDALRALRAAGRRIAILSNVDRDLLEASLERIGVKPDLAVTAEDCGSYKPAPGHWQWFLKESAAEIADVVHVGASQYHDMAPAKALGFRTVFVNRNSESVTTSPTHVIGDLRPLPALVPRL